MLLNELTKICKTTHRIIEGLSENNKVDQLCKTARTMIDLVKPEIEKAAKKKIDVMTRYRIRLPN